MKPSAMTTADHARAIALRRDGATLTEVAERLGVVPKSFGAYLARGRAGRGSAACVAFAAGWDVAGEGRLTERDLERLLERRAERGSVVAIVACLQKPWKKPVADPGPADTPLSRLMRELHRKRDLPATPDGAENN